MMMGHLFFGAAGLWSVGDVLPDNVFSRYSRGTHRQSPEAGLHRQWQQRVAGDRHAHIQHMALVDSQRKQPTVCCSSLSLSIPSLLVCLSR